MAKIKEKIKNKFKKKDNVSEDTLSEFMQEEMTKARLGLLYIFANTEAHGNYAKLILGGTISVVGSSLSADGKLGDNSGMKLAGTITSSSKTPVEELVKLVDKPSKPKKDKKEEKVEKSLWTKFKEFFSGVVSGSGEKLRDDIAPDMSKWGAAIKAIVKGVVSMCVEAAVPLSGAFDVVKGVSQACHAGWNRAASWLETRTVSQVKGVPTVIVSAIQSAMNRSLGEGLWNALKGSVQIGADVAAAGAGTLAKAIASGIELIVQLVMRIFECEAINTFCKDAKLLWRDRNSSGFHKHPELFARWFKKYALKVPAIGAVAMNCGYCGGPMHYLNMYNEGGTKISQKDFDAGVSMLVRLKRYAALYLNDIGLTFTSKDQAVYGALKAAKNYGAINDIRQNSFGNVVKGMLIS